LRPNAVRGEVILMHEVLRDTRGSMILCDEITSVYRFTGSGIWSSLTLGQQRQKNEEQTAFIRKWRPAWLKLADGLGLSKRFRLKRLN
jgi:hypothetical protein